ncbi:MAG: hypothetical protein RQM92_14135 [Candidatus Syntrophopropionicum ammoniitolerans]
MTWILRAAITPANGYWTSEVTSDPALITIDPGDGSQMATGGGWVADAQSINGKANFGFTVNYQKKGNPKGNSTFLFRGSRRLQLPGEEQQLGRGRFNLL